MEMDEKTEAMLGSDGGGGGSSSGVAAADASKLIVEMDGAAEAEEDAGAKCT